MPDSCQGTPTQPEGGLLPQGCGGIRIQHATTGTHEPAGAGQGNQGETQSQRNSRRMHPCGGRQAALPCTLTHSVRLKALCRRWPSRTSGPSHSMPPSGSTVSRYMGRIPGLTTLTCSFRKPENSHTLSEAGQERERRREGKLSMFLSSMHTECSSPSFIHSFTF